MADRWWVASSDGVWNDTANWSTTEGGAGGSSVPVAGDNAYFSDTSSTYKCTLNRDEACTNISTNSGTTGGTDDWDGDLDLSTYTLAVSNDAEFNGVSGLTLIIGSSSGNGLDVGNDLTITSTAVSLDMQTDSVIRCAGDANFGDNSSLFTNSNRGHFIKSGTGTYRQQRFENAWHDFTISSSATMSFSGSGAYLTWTNSSGTLTIDGILSIGTGNQLIGLGSGGSFVMGANGDITGSGIIRLSLYSDNINFTNNKASACSFTGELTLLRFGTTTGTTYLPTDICLSNADLILSTSASNTTLNFSTLTQGGTLSVNNFYMDNDNTSGGQTLDLSNGNPNIIISGNCDLKTGSSSQDPTVTNGTGTIEFDSSSPTIDFAGNSITGIKGTILASSSVLSADTWTVAPGETLQLQNCDIYGTLIVPNTAQLNGGNSGNTTTVKSGGTITIQTGGAYTGQSNGLTSIESGGTFTAPSGSGATIEFNGNLSVAGTWTNACNVRLFGGASGTQTYNFNSVSIGALVVDTALATKQLTGNLVASSITVTQGTWDLSTYNVSTNAVVVSGTLKMGASSGNGLTCSGLTFNAGASADLQTNSIIRNSGDLIVTDSGTWNNRFRGDYRQIGNASSFAIPSNNDFEKFILDAGYYINLTGNSYITNYSSEDTIINGEIRTNSYSIFLGASGSGGSFTFGSGSDITGSGAMQIRISSTATYTNNKSGAFSYTGTLSVQLDRFVTRQIPTGDFSNANFRLSNDNTGTGTVGQWTSGTLKCINFTNEVTSGSTMTIEASTNNPSYEISGNIDLNVNGCTLTYTAGSGTYTLTGSSGTQTIDFNNKGVESIEANSSGATKTVTSDFICSSITATAGTWNQSDRNISTNAVSITNGTYQIGGSTGSGLNCASITAGSGATILLAAGAKIECQYEIDIDPSATITDSGSTITLDGSSGSQNIDFGGKTIGDLVINCAGATKEIITDFSCNSLSGSGGTLQSSVAGTERIITVSTSGVASNMSFKDIHMNAASRINAKNNCTNNGNCLGIVFIDIFRIY